VIIPLFDGSSFNKSFYTWFFKNYLWHNIEL